MLCLVIGANGFLGKNLVAYLQHQGCDVHVALRNTIRAGLAKDHYDLVFNCAGNSKTWLSNVYPDKCLKENVIDLISDLQNLNYRLWVQFSTSMVYDNSRKEKSSEESLLTVNNMSNYAFHKLLAERYVRDYADNFLILRPTGFFGPGLKKNLLYDLRNKSGKIYYTANSFIDYLPVHIFCKMVLRLIECIPGEVVNIGSGSALPVIQLVQSFPNISIAEDARYVDDRGINLDKLRKYYPELPAKKDIEDHVMLFLKGAYE